MAARSGPSEQTPGPRVPWHRRGCDNIRTWEINRSQPLDGLVKMDGTGGGGDPETREAVRGERFTGRWKSRAGRTSVLAGQRDRLCIANRGDGRDSLGLPALLCASGRCRAELWLLSRSLRTFRAVLHPPHPPPTAPGKGAGGAAMLWGLCWLNQRTLCSPGNCFHQGDTQ